MQQLELFAPSLFMYAMTTKLAPLKLRDDILYYEVKTIRERVLADVARATFIAKVVGIDFSRYPRR